MAIPDYQTIILPLLQHLSDDKEHSIVEIREHLAAIFALTGEERKATEVDSVVSIFAGRVGWARMCLRSALLIEGTGKNVWRITPRGHALLQTNPEKVDKKVLRQYPEFVQFFSNSPNEKTPEVKIVGEPTPDEQLGTAYQIINSALANDLLSKILEQPPDFFELLVVDLLVKMGYGGSIEEAGKTVGRSGDEGIDGIIKEDRLGLDMIYIQAKRWKPGNNVGGPDINNFAGALMAKKANKGVFITTSSFTTQARELTKQFPMKIALVDGEELTRLMIKHDVGVSLKERYDVKKIDSDYFGE